MSFSIDQFKSELSGGLALSNLYSVELPRIHLRSIQRDQSFQYLLVQKLQTD